MALPSFSEVRSGQASFCWVGRGSLYHPAVRLPLGSTPANLKVAHFLTRHHMGAK